MSDDRFKDPPPPPPACRLYVAPGRPDYVTIEEIDAFTDWHARTFQLGKYRPKPAPQPLIDLREPKTEPEEQPTDYDSRYP